MCRIPSHCPPALLLAPHRSLPNSSFHTSLELLLHPASPVHWLLMAVKAIAPAQGCPPIKETPLEVDGVGVIKRRPVLSLPLNPFLTQRKKVVDI